jgi:hypothetical protein
VVEFRIQLWADSKIEESLHFINAHDSSEKLTIICEPFAHHVSKFLTPTVISSQKSPWWVSKFEITLKNDWLLLSFIQEAWGDSQSFPMVMDFLEFEPLNEYVAPRYPNAHQST